LDEIREKIFKNCALESMDAVRARLKQAILYMERDPKLVRRPLLVVIDSIAAVFDGEAIASRQVRSFLAMLRTISRENETALVLLDHP
jgi:RecA-family ATPase